LQRAVVGVTAELVRERGAGARRADELGRWRGIRDL